MLVNVGINGEEITNLSFGGTYHRHAGPCASWTRGERWTSHLLSREARLRRMTYWLGWENEETVDSDEQSDDLR